MSTFTRAFVRSLLVLSLGVLAASGAVAQVTISPTSINFGKIDLGLISKVQTITITNNGTSKVNVSSLSISLPFHVQDGLVVTTIQAGKSATYNIVFSPIAAEAYSSSAVFTVSKTNYTTTLSGTGITSTAVASLNPTSINFGNVTVGSASTQNVTVTNNGTSEVTISDITSYMPFTVGGFTTSVTLEEGQSFTFQISYNAVNTGTITGWLNLTYDVLPPGGVSLTGTGVAATSLALTNYPTFPSSIQGASYYAALVPTGGKSPYFYKITSGSLPSGLTISSSGSTGGQITGTVGSGVAVGNYAVTVQIRDSSTPTKQSITPTITIPVAAPTGSMCDQWEWDVPDTTTPLTAVNDLSSGTYEGYTGGLYGGGSDVDPSAHLSTGESLAAGIQPRDGNGTVDPTNGSIVLLSLGVSASEEGWEYFQTYANADPAKNPKVVIANGAQGGEDASQLATSTNAYWTQVLDYLIPGTYCNGVPCTADQVAAVWINNVDSAPPDPPTDITNLITEYGEILPILHTNFPNAVLTYFSSIEYGGYSNGVVTTDPETGPYDGAYAMQQTVLSQINGGPVQSPWIAWGPYYWANGLLARKDGTTWACTDLVDDGIHPSQTGGRQKIGSFLLNFFKTDPTATPWFLAP